jgi:uncharacterized protein YjbJ (UPF0337 family)
MRGRANCATSTGIPVNNDILEGKWKQLKGSVQAKWGEITDDEFDQVKGNRERLIGLVQEKYGKKKDDVRKEVDDYFKSIH